MKAMDSIQEAIRTKLAELLISALDSYKEREGEDQLPLADLYVQLDTDTYAIKVYDDVENLLDEDVFLEIKQLDSDEESAFLILENLLRETTLRNDVVDKFHSFDLTKPFSLLVVNSQFEQKGEVYLLEEGDVIIDESLFKNIDKELDDFLDKLMNE
jgi:hypothetical protein